MSDEIIVSEKQRIDDQNKSDESDRLYPIPVDSMPDQPSLSMLDRGEDKEFLQFPTFTEDEVRKALIAEVKKHRFWRNSATKRMRIINIDSSMALRYTLETFVETRTTFDVSEPLSASHSLDNQIYGGDNVWDVDCVPSQMFMPETKIYEYPGTAKITSCTSCSGQGQSHCFFCRGFGTSRCNMCNGTGMKTGVPHPAVVTHPVVGTYAASMPSRSTTAAKPGLVGAAGSLQPYGLGTPIHFHSMTGFPPPGVATMDLCFFCHGRGLRECFHCDGHGKKSCTVCGGSGQLRTVTKLKVKFEVDKMEYLQEAGLPEKILQHVTGEIVLMESKPFVLPVRNFPIDVINENSRRFIQVQVRKFLGYAKIIQQRHMIEAVPIADVTYDLKNKHGRYWVAGLERVAYVPNYPEKCTIL